MRAAVIGLVVLAAVVLALAAYLYVSAPRAQVNAGVGVSPEEINALGQYQPIEINAPIESNVDIPTVSASDLELNLPQNV